MSDKFWLWILVTGLYLFVATNSGYKLYSKDWFTTMGVSSVIYFFILRILITKEKYALLEEGYTPYRNTGGCKSDGNFAYHNQYLSQQFYLQDPRVYPTSDNFFKALIQNQKLEQNYVRKQREDIETQFSKTLKV